MVDNVSVVFGLIWAQTPLSYLPNFLKPEEIISSMKIYYMRSPGVITLQWFTDCPLAAYGHLSPSTQTAPRSPIFIMNNSYTFRRVDGHTSEKSRHRSVYSCAYILDHNHFVFPDRLDET